MVEQGSPEWRALRCGKVTASRIADVTAKGRGGAPSAMRANYLSQVVAERLTGVPQEDTFESAAMAWGKKVEPDARAAYAFYHAKVELVAFVDHPVIAMSGCSPDGLVGDKGLAQFKCPNTATHIATLRGASIDGGYIKQMQWEMACTGRLWCDFVSYDPRMPEEMRLHVRRVARDSAMIVEIAAAVSEFQAEVEAAVADLLTRFRAAAA